MKKCTEYTLGETVVIQESDFDADYSYYGKLTDNIGPGVIVRSAGEFYERLPAKMERDYNGQFIGKGEPEYTTYSGEYNGFIPENHIPFDPKNWSHVSRKVKSEVIKKYGSLKNAEYAYALEDYKRIEALFRGEWEYVYIAVRTYIHTNTGLSDYVHNSLCGIEAEYGEENRKYREDIVKDLIDENIAELQKMGFSLDEIKKSTDNRKYPKGW